MNRKDFESDEYRVARAVIQIFLDNFPEVKEQISSYIDKFISYLDKPEMQPILENYIKCDISIIKKKDIPLIILSFFRDEQERINKTLYTIYLFLKKIYENND
ncbi:MAG: hypothetical protein QW622_03400 [Candidatus Pacearchaeota archaeon]